MRARSASFLASLAVISATSGCSFMWAPPDEVELSAVPVDATGDEARLRDDMARNPKDLGARFALARQQEQKGLLEAASLNYGVVAESLMPHRYTRAWLCFARVELALDRDRSAEKALREVLSVVPDDETWYGLNPDYRDAAILLAPLLSRDERWDELEKLRARFIDQLGGELEDWPVR